MVGFSFLPKDDQSEFEIAITTPEGWSLDRVDRTFREIEQTALRSMPEVIDVMTTIGDTSGKMTRGQGEVTRGGIYVRLVDLDDRTFSTHAGRPARHGCGHREMLAEVQERGRRRRPGPDGFSQFAVMGRLRQPDGGLSRPAHQRAARRRHGLGGGRSTPMSSSRSSARTSTSSPNTARR